MIPFSVEDYKSSKLTVFALIILLSLFTCFCHLPFAAPQKPPTSESDETAEEILLDYDSLAELGTSIAIPEFDINRIEYELDANGSLVWMEYPLEEDVLFDQVPADISLVYTAGDQKVNEALVYTFRDVGEIDSLWLALPKSLVESVGSVADFSAISELSGLKITDIVIHDVDPLIELINAKIEETDAAIAITGRILDIDLESPNGIDELTASVKVHAQTLGRIRGLRQQLNSALKVASTKGKESEASEQIQALLILYPDSFFRSDCDQLESRSTLYAYYLCKAITHQSGQWCNKVTESDGCKSLTYNALTRRHPACGSLPSREEIEQCLMLAAVKADYEKGCKSRDSAFGHRIENQDIQKACIAGVKQDPVQCNSITDEAAREQCCNLMQVTSLRQQCMGSFE